MFHISIWGVKPTQAPMTTGLNFGSPVIAWAPLVGGMKGGWYGSECKSSQGLKFEKRFPLSKCLHWCACHTLYFDAAFVQISQPCADQHNTLFLYSYLLPNTWCSNIVHKVTSCTLVLLRKIRIWHTFWTYGATASSSEKNIKMSDVSSLAIALRNLSC